MSLGQRRTPGLWGRWTAYLVARWRHWRVRLLVLTLLPLLLLWQALLPGRVFLPQSAIQWEPLRSEHPQLATEVDRAAHYFTGDRISPVLMDQREFHARSETGAGTGWQPNLSLGLPLLGNALHGPGYPPNALSRALGPERAAGWQAFLALLLAGLGVWRFLERRGLPKGAAALGALGLQAGGFAVANLHYGMKVDAVLWLPFCWTALEDLARGRPWAGLWVLLTAALPFTAGFPPIALFALLAALLYALVFLGPFRRLFGLPGEVRQGALPRALLLLTLAPGLAAPALWPTLEASSLSLRTDKDAAAVLQESLPYSSALGLLVPYLWGHPSDPSPGGQQPAVWWFTPKDQWTKAVDASPLEWDPWSGTALLGLAVVGFFYGGRRARFPALLLVLAFGFAQGWPVVRAAYHLPGLGAGAPARALAVAWIAWAWLAALGAAALLERRPGALRAALGWFGAIAICGLVVASGIQPGDFGSGMEKRLAARHGVAVEEVRQVIDPRKTFEAARDLERNVLHTVWLCALAGVALIAGTVGAAGPKRRLPAALFLCFAVEAWTVGRDQTGSLPAAAGDFPDSPRLETVREAAAGARVMRVDPSPSGVEHTLQLARPNMLSAYGIRDVSAYVAFTPRRTVEYFSALHPGTRFRSGVASLPSPQLLDHPMLDRADVGAVLAREPIDHPALVLQQAADGFVVHRRLGALGPARLVPRGEVVEGDLERLARLSDRGTDPREVVLLGPEASAIERRPEPDVSDAGLRADPSLRFERAEPDRMAVDLWSAEGGWLVVHEAYAPGWRATLDGRELPVVPADHAFLGAQVPAGHHRVEFVYAPASRWAGAVSGAVVAIGLLLSWRRRSAFALP